MLVDIQEEFSRAEIDYSFGHHPHHQKPSLPRWALWPFLKTSTAYAVDYSLTQKNFSHYAVLQRQSLSSLFKNNASSRTHPASIRSSSKLKDGYSA